MSTLGKIHVAFGLLALMFGPVIFSQTKGTRLHRVVGRCYVVSLLGVNVTALMLYHLFGHFGPFHVLAVLNLVSLLIGFGAILSRWPKTSWLQLHYNWICWSYVGVCAATAAELTVRLPLGLEGWTRIAVTATVATVAVTVIGGYLIHTSERRILDKYGHYQRSLLSRSDK